MRALWCLVAWYHLSSPTVSVQRGNHQVHVPNGCFSSTSFSLSVFPRQQATHTVSQNTAVWGCVTPHDYPCSWELMSPRPPIHLPWGLWCLGWCKEGAKSALHPHNDNKSFDFMSTTVTQSSRSVRTDRRNLPRVALCWSTCLCWLLPSTRWTLPAVRPRTRNIK